MDQFRVEYKWTESLLDLLLLLLLRLSLLLGLLLGQLFNPSSSIPRLRGAVFSQIFICIVLLILVFSPTKLLALSEVDANLQSWGCWIALSWNIIAAVGMFAVWKWILCRRFDGMEEEAEDEETPLVVDEEKEKKKKEMEVKLTRETFSHVGRLLRYCNAEWHWYALGFLFLFIYSIARIFIPYYTGQVIANIVVTRSSSELLKCVFIMGGLSVVSAIFGGLRGGCFDYGLARISRAVRGDLFTSLVRQDIGFYDATKTGEVTSRLTADCQTMSDTVGVNVNVFLRNVVMLVGAFVFMFRLSWRLSLISFIAIPVIGFVSKVYGTYYDHLSEGTQTSLAKANEVADEVLSSMRTVRSFANEEAEARRYRGFLQTTLDFSRKKAIAYVGYMWTNELFDSAILVAVLWYGGHLVISGRMLPNDLIAFLLYQMQLGENLYSIGWVWTGLMQSVGASRKVFDYIDRKPTVQNDGILMPTTMTGKLEFNDVCFSYPTRPETQVINNMSFTVNAGEIVALVGPSGGGKSSCVSLLQHFYEPSSGTVRLDGVSISDFNHKYLHTKIALVGQEPVLFARSVRENIAYGLETVDDDEVRRVAKMANAHDFVSEAKDGYETNVGEKGIQMSGGQKQRIAIARALIRRPVILLLDEATSALDSESEHLVQDAIYKNLSGHTVLLIAHRLSTVERADRILVIDKGRVVQMGTHRSLLEQDGIYRNLVQRQLLGCSIKEEERSTRDGTVLSLPRSPPSSPDILESGRSSGTIFASPIGSSRSSVDSTPRE